MKKALLVLFCLTLAIGLTSTFMSASDSVIQSPAQGQVSASPSSPSDPQGKTELTERRTAFSKTYSTGEYSYQTVIGISSMHYRDAEGKWMEIDATLVPTDGAWVVEKGHWKLKVKADGTLEARATGGKKFTTKPLYMGYLDTETDKISVINYFNKNTIGFAEDNKYTWPSAYPETDMKVYYTSDLLKENIVLSQSGRDLLPSPSTYGIDAGKAQLVYAYAADWDGCDIEDSLGNKVVEKGMTKLSGKSFSESLYIKDGVKEVARLPGDVATVSDVFLGVVGEVSKGFYDGLLTCGIMYSDLIAMPEGDIVIDPQVYFYPDYGPPDQYPENTSMDGVIYSCANSPDWLATFQQLRNGEEILVASVLNQNEARICGQSDEMPGFDPATGLVWQSMTRSVLLFDTSPLPDDATINWAVVGLHINSKDDDTGTSPSYVLVSSNPASNTDVVPADWHTFSDVPLSYTVPWGDLVPGTESYFVLNNEGIGAIKKEGVTKLGLRNYTYDVLGEDPPIPQPWPDPTAHVWLNVQNAEQWPYNIPQLIVNYTVNSWSFAIIADTHIGQGDSDEDYGNVGWLDGNSGDDGGNDTPMGKLRQSVDRINWLVEHQFYNIKFVVILGDISVSAEQSEFLKAKEILDTLSVDWIPIMGNHDVWPYSGSGESFDQAPYSSGYPDYNGADYYYHTILADPQYNILSTKFANWEWPASYICESYPPPPGYECAFTWNQETTGNNTPRNNYWENFSFDYNGLHFMALDFNERDPALNGKGVGPEAQLFDSDKAHGTWYTFKIKLDDYIARQPTGYDDVVLLAHHPMLTINWQWVWDWPPSHAFPWLAETGFTGEEMTQIYDDFLSKDPYKGRVWAEFCGHIHDDKIDPDVKGVLDIIRTAANYVNPRVRIVQVLPDGSKYYNFDAFTNVAPFDTSCPVDFVLTDPDGLTISKSINEIPGATYSEYDRDDDGLPDDRVWIPDLKPGNYTVQVIAEPGAQPTDTYSLTVSPMEQDFGYTPIVLAEDVPISEIPSEPYVFTHKERATTQLTYTGDLVGTYSDSINLSATLTDGGNPVAGKTIKFMIGNQTASAVTGADGIATTSITLEQPPGQYCYSEIRFDGDQDFLPSYDYALLEVLIKVEAGTNQNAAEGQVVNFSGSVAPETGNYTVEWDFGDGGNSTGNLTTSHTYVENGLYTVTLSVTDDNTGRGNDTLTVTVNNVAPIVEAGGNQTVNEGDTVSFSGNYTEPGWLDTHSILWTFGDGGNSTGNLTPTHIYANSGNYTVTLTVTDDDEGVGSDTLTVTVNAGQTPWDLNGDHVCNIGDVVKVGLKWGLTGSPGWIPEDLNLDGVIDTDDVVVLGLHWGETQ